MKYLILALVSMIFFGLGRNYQAGLDSKEIMRNYYLGVEDGKAEVLGR